MKFKKFGYKFDKNTSSKNRTAQQGAFRFPFEKDSKQIDEEKNSVKISTKGKQPTNKRTWLIVLVIFVALCILISVIGSHKSEKIVWSDMVMGSMLPEPPSERGEIHENSKNELWVDIYKVSEKQYSDYITACEAKGFNVDAENEDHSFAAYNPNGYKLELSCYDEKLKIDLNIPLVMSQIEWPSSKLGELLPVPKSSSGNFSFETDTSFEVYIADTTTEDYKQYVAEVQKAGFTIDYNKTQKEYSAKNVDGYSVTVEYEGFHIMLIRISTPDEDDLSIDDTTVNEQQTETTSSTTTQTTTATTSTTTTTIVEEESTADAFAEYDDEEPTTKKSRTVYTTPYGTKYHYSKSCAGKNATKSELDQVKGSYGPCKKCVG